MRVVKTWLHCGLGCALGVVGCSAEDVDSDAIRTQGMFADMLALAPGDGTTLVRVELAVGGESGTLVTLVGDDRLQASFAGATESLAHAGRGRYERRMIGETAGDVSVQLLRGPDDANAGGGASLPEPFVAVLETDASSAIARDTSVELSWSPALPGGVLRWQVKGDCLWTESGSTADAGRLSLAADTFRVLSTHSGEECEVEVQLDREGSGAADSVWVPSSRFRAIQRRAVRFISRPSNGERDAPSILETSADAG